MGTVTTGDAGSDAAVTNSGTGQKAVFDFVIPRGDAGTAPASQYLNAYSTPAHPGSAGAALIFDLNGDSQGAAVSHTPGSGVFTIQTPGNYLVSFHTTVAPASNVNFPQAVLIYLKKQGTEVPGTAVQHIFHTSADAANVAFAQIVRVPSAPASLEFVASGGGFVYSDASASISYQGALS